MNPITAATPDEVRDMYRAKEDGMDNSVNRKFGVLGTTSFRAFCEQALRSMVAGYVI